jgi:hypothetical protein
MMAERGGDARALAWSQLLAERQPAGHRTSLTQLGSSSGNSPVGAAAPPSIHARRTEIPRSVKGFPSSGIRDSESTSVGFSQIEGDTWRSFCDHYHWF